MIKTNHVATNIITKGFVNSFPLTNGLLTNLEYEIITHTKKHGGIGYTRLHADIKKAGIDDITAIKVYVNWTKNIVEYPYLSVELLENKITADLIQDYGESAKKIKIEVIKLD